MDAGCIDGGTGELKLAYLQQEKLVTRLGCLACFISKAEGSLGHPPVEEAALTDCC